MIKLNDFVTITKTAMVNSRRDLITAESQGLLQVVETPGFPLHLPRASVPLWTDILLCADVPGWYIVELIGAQPKPTPFTLKKHHGKSINSYLGQLDLAEGKALISVRSETRLNGGLLRTSDAEPLLTARFPEFASLYHTSLVGTITDGNILDLSHPEANRLNLQNCMLVHKRDGAVRVRQVVWALLVRSEESAADYASYLAGLLSGPDVPGVSMAVSGHEVAITTAAQFTNLFLLDSVHETTIGQFLVTHGNILTTAFGAIDCVGERSFEWQVGTNPSNEEAIRPDIMLQRTDGKWNICELKLPLLDRKRLTKGERKRRRFTDAVAEGVAQLANYQEYFSHPSNRQWVRDHYGMEVQDPSLILIVGNYENIDSVQIAEASRQLQSSYQILDYDTVAQLYLAADSASLSRGPNAPTAGTCLPESGQSCTATEADEDNK